MRTRNTISAILGGLLCLFLGSAACFGQHTPHSTFTTFDVPGASLTIAFSINPRGDIVGDYVDASGNTHGFLLSKGKFTTIDVPGAVLTDAGGINPRGDIVGDYVDASGNTHGYLLSK